MRYAVIGGGILGLTAGFRLASRGHDVVVIEQGAVPGGLASSFEVAPGIWLERFYHHLFRSDRRAIALIDELGLGDRLRWHRPASTVMVGDVPWRLDSVSSLLRFRPIPPASRLRMGAAIAALKALPSPRPIERHPATGWMRRACGPRAYGGVWGPLLRSKFGDAAETVSMGWLWARLHDRTTELGYLDGGFHQLYSKLAAAIVERDGEVRLGVPVAGIARSGDRLEVVTDRVERFDGVLSTVAPGVLSRLTPDVGEAWARRSPTAPLAVQCLVLALDRPLTGIYWIGATDPAWPFLAVVEHTALIPPTVYGGRHLVYLGAYRTPDDPLLQADTPGLLEVARPLLRTLNPAFDADWVTDAWVFADPFAQPVVDTGYRDRIPPFETALPGLFAASMFQVYPHDRGQNYSIALADRVVAAMERGARG